MAGIWAGQDLAGRYRQVERLGHGAMARYDAPWTSGATSIGTVILGVGGPAGSGCGQAVAGTPARPASELVPIGCLVFEMSAGVPASAWPTPLA